MYCERGSLLLFRALEGVDEGKAFMIFFHNGAEDVIENIRIDCKVHFRVMIPAGACSVRSVVVQGDLKSERSFRGWVSESHLGGGKNHIGCFGKFRVRKEEGPDIVIFWRVNMCDRERVGKIREAVSKGFCESNFGHLSC